MLKKNLFSNYGIFKQSNDSKNQMITFPLTEQGVYKHFLVNLVAIQCHFPSQIFL